MSKKFRAVSALFLVAAFAVTASLFLGSSERVSAQRDAGEPGSHAYARHQDALGLADKEGPASYADQVAELNAYPAAGITADEIAGAQTAFNSIKGHGFGRGKHSTASWFSSARPGDLPVVAQPPRQRVPGLRTDHGVGDLADVRQVQCTRVGRRRRRRRLATDKALSGNPRWVNVSDGYFASGAIGALTYDAAHHTLYAGTGEDAARVTPRRASVSTSRPTTATPGQRSAATPLRQPGDPAESRSIRTTRRGNTFTSPTGAACTASRRRRPVRSRRSPALRGVGVWKSTDGGATFTLLAPQNGRRLVRRRARRSRRASARLAGRRGRRRPDACARDLRRRVQRGRVAFDRQRRQPGRTSIRARSIRWSRNTSPFFRTCGAAADRSEFALVTTPDGHTRMYQTEGDSGAADGYERSRTSSATGTTAASSSPTASSGEPDVRRQDEHRADDTHRRGRQHRGQLLQPRLRDVRLLHRPVLVRPGREQPARAAEHGLRLRLVRVRRGPDLIEASSTRSAALEPCCLLSRDGGNTFTDLTEDATRRRRRTACTPISTRWSRSGQAAAVLGGLGRRPDAVGRHAGGHLGAM